MKKLGYLIILLSACASSTTKTDTVNDYKQAYKEADCLEGNKQDRWTIYNNEYVKYKERERMYHNNCYDSSNSDAFCSDFEEILRTLEERALRSYERYIYTCPPGEY